MSKRIVCPKCNAVIMWNERDSITQCKLCGTKYKMHPKNNVSSASVQSASVQPVLMPPLGRGQVDYLTVPTESITRNRPLIKSYIPKNWKYECKFLYERTDMVSNPLVPAIVFTAPDNSAKIFYAGECFYKHIEPIPQNAQLQGALDDFRVNRNSPSFLRLKSYMSAKDYCNFLAQSTGANNLSILSEKNADSTELARHRQIANNFTSKGFYNVNTEWAGRTYRGTDGSGQRVAAVSETRVIQMSKAKVASSLQMAPAPGMFGMRMMPRMVQQQVEEHFWITQYELTLLCLESVYNRAIEEFNRINQTLNFLPGMEQSKADAIALAQNALAGIAQNQAASMDRSSKIIADTQAYTSNIQHQMISDNAASHNRAANMQSEMIRDVNVYNTNTGGFVEASTSYDHVYQNRQNPDVFAAHQGDSFEFGVDFEELTRSNGDY